MSRQDKNRHLKSGVGLASAPGFFRRMAAIIYDLFLLVALLFVATSLLLPFNAGVAFTSSQYFYPIYLLLVSFFFYAWFWTHGGQTLGMRAWKIKVMTYDLEPISWVQASIRFISAIASLALFGMGFLWILVDKNRLGWHDYLSRTSLFAESETSGR